jgi:hypothetical protein
MTRNEISDFTRRDIIDEITLGGINLFGRLGEVDFLSRVFDLTALPSVDDRFAVTYVQTSVIAPPSESRDRLLRLFEEPCLTEYAAGGRALSEEVVAAQNENPPEVELRLRRCLELHLALAETDGTVQYLFPARTSF